MMPASVVAKLKLHVQVADELHGAPALPFSSPFAACFSCFLGGPWLAYLFV
jgi:hypothetical protein